MDFLKKIIHGCKQHYEKVILTVTLIGLGLAVWFLYQASLNEQQKIVEYQKGVEKRPVRPLPPINLARSQEALKKAASPPALNLTGGHYLFNPVTWQVGKDGKWVKIVTGKEIGPSVMIATNIRPLNFSVALDRVATSGTGPDLTVTGYHLVTTNEAALLRQPKRQMQFAHVGVSNRTDTLFLREVKGPPAEPSELVVEIRETGERVRVLPGQPFTRTVAYEADLIYPITGKRYSNVRKGQILTVAGDSYKVTDITAETVVLSDESNLKTYNVPLASAK